MNAKLFARYAALVSAAVIITAPQPSAYVLKPYKWDTVQVPFYVNPANLDVPASAALAAVQEAAYAWTNQSNTAFSFYYGGDTSGTTVMNNGRNEVFFRNSSNDTAIATTYTYSSGSGIVDTDIVFWDGAYSFFTGSAGCAGGFYIEDIATHEFGHALGLAHSPVADATMYSGAYYCAVDHRWLAEDDKQAVEVLYPLSAANNPPVVTTSSPSDYSSWTEGSPVMFQGSATDAEDGDLASSLVWISSVDGQIGSGASFQKTLSPGNHTITARVTDSKGATAEARLNVGVTATPSGFSATGSGYKVKGLQKADLKWIGATSAWIDIYRNDARVTTAQNTGSYSDNINQKGSGAYTYRVCEAGTSTCSNQVRIAF